MLGEFPGARVILYRSRAKGTARRIFDWNVAVLFGDDFDRSETRRRLADLAYPSILDGFHVRTILFLVSLLATPIPSGIGIDIDHYGVEIGSRRQARPKPHHEDDGSPTP